MLGTYIIDKIEGDTINQKYVKKIHLKKGKKAELIYNDTLLIGKWKEIDIQEFHYIELVANEELEELHILKDSNGIIKLYFIDPIDFRGGHYYNLRCIKAKQ